MMLTFPSCYCEYENELLLGMGGVYAYCMPRNVMIDLDNCCNCIYDNAQLAAISVESTTCHGH